MLDADLAEIYSLETKLLNEQVRRNLKRFPDDFMLQLIEEEAESLWSHFATLKSGRDKDTFMTTLANQNILSFSKTHDWKKGCVPDTL